ncbi:hypothetical protein ABIB50_002034 [Mucilaginibacter sp. UYCu711]
MASKVLKVNIHGQIDMKIANKLTGTGSNIHFSADSSYGKCKAYLIPELLLEQLQVIIENRYFYSFAANLKCLRKRVIR